MFSFFDLLRLNNIEPSRTRLVRHGTKEIMPLEVFHQTPGRFDEYMAWQVKNKFSKTDYLAVFVPSMGTKALFLGIWKIDGVTRNAQLEPQHRQLLKVNELPLEWYDKHERYDITKTEAMSELSERLVIDWGKSTVAWVQKLDKKIFEIKPPNSIGEFKSFDDVHLSYVDLQKLITDKAANFTWVNALSSINAIYLINDNSDGKLYVGSAYGADGLLGRWETYSINGHGGNKLLFNKNPQSFEFSILEIIPKTFTASQVIDRENKWKTKLGTRAYGLNGN